MKRVPLMQRLPQRRVLVGLSAGIVALAAAALLVLVFVGSEVESVSGAKAGDPKRALVASGCQARPPIRQRQVLLGCGAFTGGRVLQVRRERRRGAAGCLEIYGLGDGKSRACGYAPDERRPRPDAAILADSIAQTDKDAPLEVYGSTSPEVDRVTIDHSDGSEAEQRTAATLIRIADQAALQAAGLEQPFGYFVAELPPNTARATAVAKGPDGGTIESVRILPGFRGLGRDLLVYADE